MKVFDEDWLESLRRKHQYASKYILPFIARLALDPALYSEMNKIEVWFESLPEDVKPDIRSRLRSASNHQHFGAYYELLLREFFRSLGYSVTVHPKLDQGEPDLVITGKTLDKPMIIEVATVFDEPYWQKEEQKLNLILQQLAKIEHYFLLDLSVQSEHIPEKPDYNKLRHFVQTQLDHLHRQAHPGPRQFQYNEDGLHLQLMAVPSSDKTPILASHGLPARFIGTGQLRNVITKKINKYKTIKKRGLHFAVALNITNMPAGERGLLHDLFGKPGIRISRDKNGHVIDVQQRTDSSGLFTPKPGLAGQPRNTRLSALLNIKSEWLRPQHQNAQVRRQHFLRIIHNHWAACPIDAEVFCGYPQFLKISEDETGIHFGWIDDRDDKPFDC